MDCDANTDSPWPGTNEPLDSPMAKGLGCDSANCLLCHYSQSCNEDTDASSQEASCRTLSRLHHSWTPCLDDYLFDNSNRWGDALDSSASAEGTPRHETTSGAGASPSGLASSNGGGSGCGSGGRPPQNRCWLQSLLRQAQAHSTVNPWRYQPGFQHRVEPAQAQLVPLAQLAAPPQHEQLSAARGVSHSNNFVSALEFSPDGQLLVSGGVSKQIRLYRLADLGAAAGDDPSPSPTKSLRGPSSVMQMPGKISCIAWDPMYNGEVITCGDHDGVLHQAHVGSGHLLTEVEAHSGRRIRSVCHSPLRPHICGTASDDGTARVWSGRTLDVEAVVLRPGACGGGGGAPASVCCVEFSPTDANLLALASSDHRVYLYDLRATAEPLEVLQHHTGPVSYVRFLGGSSIVSASTDATLAVWDISGPGSGASALSQAQQGAGLWAGDEGGRGGPAAAAGRRPWRVCSGHCNDRNFVGLAVRAEDGLLACGSETGRLYTYHTSWSTPLASLSMALPLGPAKCGAGLGTGHMSAPDLCAIAGIHAAGGARRSRLGCVTPAAPAAVVSAVCWQPAHVTQGLGLPPVLAAGTSFGDVQLLALSGDQF